MSVLRELFERHRPPAVTTVLCARLGRGGAEPWQVTGARCDAVNALPSPADAKGVYDVVVLESGFEQEPWPRWTLQQLHHVLRPGGLLLLATEPAGMPRTPRAAWDSLRALAFSARRFAHKRLRPGVPFPHVPPRVVLPDAELRGVLDALHFEVLERRAPRVIAARALPALAGIDPALPFPEPEAAVAAWDAATAADLERRDAWVRRHPEWSGPKVGTLDPARWAGRSVVVLAPHPDDELIGCGGTLLRAIGHGARVTCIQATDGSAGAGLFHEPEEVRKTRRLEEARRVADAAGIRELVLWRQDNRCFRPGPEFAERLARQLADLQPAVVFVPFVTDIHPDHQVLADLLVRALALRPEGWGDLAVAQYEVWSRVWPTHACEVTPVMPEVADILMRYESALREADYIHLLERRNFANAVSWLGRSGYAELFHLLPAEGFVRLRSGAAVRG